jgi:site-specific recombinase XerD
MTDPSRVSVSGSLEEFAEGFLAELAGLGYAPRSSEAQMRLMKHLSGWLAAQGLTAGDLTAEVADRFVAARRRSYSNLRSPKALVPLLAHLRRRGAAPTALVVVAVAPADALSELFARYLSTQRGLAPDTVRSYVSQVRPFLVAHAGDEGGWASLTARQVAEFVTDRAVGQRPRSVSVGANALRALLRWMWRERLFPSPLADSVGSVAAPTGAGVPRSLSASEIGDLLAALPADGPARLRNEAMLVLMCRLGLRAGEVASLRLDDIDWRVGVLAVRGKRARRDQLPLPVDVGEHLAAYLRRGRPAGTAHREVFLALDAPHHRLSGSAVSSVASRALARAGVDGPGAAHRLRHTAACRVLAGGGGLVEAGQLLRHASAAATAIYAKSDLAALAVLARSWPLGGHR